jgi:predicted NAD/FAD-dependent oxidoreductase
VVLSHLRYTDASLRHFVVSRGTSALCEHLLTGANVKLAHEVTNLELTPSVGAKPAQWRVTAADGTTSSFDGVVLTPPAPQALRMAKLALHDNDEASRLLTDSLSQVAYSSRWALAMSFPAEAWGAAAALEWEAKYVSKEESESVCYMAIDQLKRGGHNPSASHKITDGAGPMLVVHSGVPWSIKHGAASARDDEPDELRSSVQVRAYSPISGGVCVCVCVCVAGGGGGGGWQ